MRGSIAKVFLIAVALAGGINAHAGAPAAPANPAAYFLGTWVVEAREPAGKDAVTLCYSVTKFVGDAWLAGHGTSKTEDFAVRDVWGQDPQTKEIFRTVFDASGTYAVVRSPGWSGETLILEGDARSSGGVTRVRETIVRRGPDAFDATWEARRDGSWKAYSIETVTRDRRGQCLA